MKPTDAGHLTNVRIDTPKTNNQGPQIQPSTLSTRSPDDSRDKVTLTSEARHVQQLQESLKSMPDVNRQKVDAIKTSIAAGTFEADAELIASRLLSLSQDLKP